MAKYLVEFIGTFFLVFTVGCFAIKPSDLAPLAIGSVLMVMVFAGGHVSGAHFNPAVTLAVWLRGRCPNRDAVAYVIAQIIGALAAAAAAMFVTAAELKIPTSHPEIPRALLAEFIFTFALCYVVLNVATAKATSGNSFYGLAIGFTVLAGAFTVGGVSGGVFNPAVGTGLAALQQLSWVNLGLYVATQLAAGAVAAMVFRFAHPGDV